MKRLRDTLCPAGTALILVLIGGAGYAGEDSSSGVTASPPAGDVSDDATSEADDATIALDCLRASGPFAWNCAGPIPGMTCTQVLELADPDTWGDNYLCSFSDLGIQWSSAGAINGMRCASIYEPAEPPAQTWRDNYLCVPVDSHFHFLWSYAGPLAGLGCLQWYEPADPQTWGDNWLCWLYA
jgi:hypothetical protein